MTKTPSPAPAQVSGPWHRVQHAARGRFSRDRPSVCYRAGLRSATWTGAEQAGRADQGDQHARAGHLARRGAAACTSELRGPGRGRGRKRRVPRAARMRWLADGNAARAGTSHHNYTC